MPTGRPTPDGLFDVYIAYLRRGKGIYAAAEATGIDHETVRKYRDRTPGFSEREVAARAAFAEEVEDALLDVALDRIEYQVDPDTGERLKNDEGVPIRKQKDAKAALDWLKARNRNVFAPDATIHHQLEAGSSLKELMGDFGALRAELERRRELTQGAIEVQEVTDGG